MYDVATLGLAVDSGQVTKATPELNKLTVAAGQAEAAADRLKATTASGAAAQSAATAAVKANTAALHAQAAAARMTANTQRMLGFQINDIVVSLASGMNPGMVALQQGSQIAQMGLKEVASAALGMARSFAPVLAVVGLVTAAIAGLTGAINESSDVTVTFGDTALAVWQVISSGIWQFVKPAVDWLGGTLSSFWEWIAPGLKTAGNGLIATFLGAFDAIKIVWQSLPQVMGDAAISSVNIMMGVIESFLNENRMKIGQFMMQIAPALGPLSATMSASGASLLSQPVKMQQIDNPYAGTMGGVASDAAGAFSGAFGNDYLGTFFDAVSGQAKKNAYARLAEDAEKAKKGTKGVKDAFGELVGMTNVFADATRSAFSNLGTGIIDAFKKGGDVAANFFSMVLDKIGQVGESLLNKGLNSLLDIGINALFGGIGSGLGSGAIGRGVYGGMGGFFPAFPGMATGGTVAGAGMSWVGEKGPELLYMPKGASVIPHAQSLAMAARNDNAITYAPTYHLPEGLSKGEALALMEAHDRAFLEKLNGNFAGAVLDAVNNPRDRGKRYFAA